MYVEAVQLYIYTYIYLKLFIFLIYIFSYNFILCIIFQFIQARASFVSIENLHRVYRADFQRKKETDLYYI